MPEVSIEYSAHPSLRRPDTNTMTSTIGIPIKLLNEAQVGLLMLANFHHMALHKQNEHLCSKKCPRKLTIWAQNHVVSLELTSGQVFRGKLIEAEDNMNVQLKDITVVARDGRVSHLDQVYIRGSHVRFFIVPDMLRNAPMFRSRGVKGRGVGMARGRATVNRARGQRGEPTLNLITPYYSVSVPIWHETLPASSAAAAALAEWETEWLHPEASEVVQNIGAWVAAFKKPAAQTGDGGLRLLRTVSRVVAHHQRSGQGGSYAGSVAAEPCFVALGMPQSLSPRLDFSDEEWEDRFRECGGWEWIDSEAQGKNTFGEKVGMERLQEVLEANEWDGGGETLEDDGTLEDLGLEEGENYDNLNGIDIGSDNLEIREAMLTRGDRGEIAEGASQDVQLEDLEHLVVKMQAIKGFCHSIHYDLDPCAIG
ncbi:MAG: hypothetical protein LQ351_003209 [Letrouitia transgressa]|nr:MAG: hypothetical protein LQ351_003209 [Letrouitia transgressa]